MRVINTTKEAINVRIKGVEYKLPAEGELPDVPAEHAEYWKTMLHNFLILDDDEIIPEVAKIEKKIMEEENNEVKVEENLEEVKEEEKDKVEETVEEVEEDMEVMEVMEEEEEVSNKKKK